MRPQKTLSAPVTLDGVGLHTGAEVRVELRPAPEDHGVEFVRSDLPGAPRVRACIENLASEPRRTALVYGSARVHTVEHLMAVLHATGVTNLEVRLDGPELPGLDGSALPFYEAVKTAGIEAQAAPAQEIQLRGPIAVRQHDASAVALSRPDGLRVSYTLEYPSPWIGTQFFAIDLDEDTFAREVAPARTFVLEEEVPKLRAAGLGKGASTQNTLVLSAQGPIENTLRFENECVRHKVLDLVGDLYLLGRRLCADVLATRSGHALNLELAKRISAEEACGGAAGALDAAGIEKLLPHRYPFVMLDRVLEIRDGAFARGLKAVSSNESYFRGHFPGRPVMPGVLQVEAMAQLGGVLLLSHEQNRGSIAYLIGIDEVKFRRLVVPGDSLVLEADIESMKAKTARVRARAYVGDKLVAEARILYRLAPQER
jgi:UDP-3-O-[3-hydroxymyristoyl] N-acetylglucosamine deacetylase/3-hydroxyacyl-[acyl-carrier-protein] dehydratase